MKETLKNWFTEEESTPELTTMPPRQARTAVERVREAIDEATPPKRVWKSWVAQYAAGAPWVAVAMLLFALVAKGPVASAALTYGVMKVAIAVVLTFIADSTMFRGMRACRENGWVPMIRRAMVFLAICWMMAVT